MLSLTLGPLAISVGQALVMLALVAALIMGTLAARRRDAPAAPVGDALVSLVLMGLVTARVAFVLLYFSSYGLHPLAWIDIRDGGFAVWAGLLGMALYAGYLAWRRRALRRPLAIALLGGVLTWVLIGGALTLMDNQASHPPQVTLYTLDGKRTGLASVQARAGGRPMVVNLWASWCPPCRTEMPVLQRAQAERGDIVFVFANQGEATETIHRFMQRMQLDLDHVLRDRHRDIAQHVGSVALPTTLFYDAGGRLVDSHLGQLSDATLERALERFDPSPHDSGQRTTP